MFHESVSRERNNRRQSEIVDLGPAFATRFSASKVFAGNTFVVSERGSTVLAPVVAASSSSFLERVPRRSLRVARRAESVSVAPVTPLVSAPRSPPSDVTISFQLLCCKCRNGCAVSKGMHDHFSTRDFQCTFAGQRCRKRRRTTDA